MKEVVIKISDAMYKYITMEHTLCIKEVGEYLFGLVRYTGILLPEGHGNLVDVDALLDQISRDEREVFTKHQVWLLLSQYNDTPTIIKADKEVEQE